MLTGMTVISTRPGAPVPVIPGSVDSANKDPIHIRDIQGLGPVKAAINTTQFGDLDGELFSGSSVGKRNIVLTLGLNPNWQDQSMTSLRQLLYSYFMTKMGVRLVFSSTELPDVQIDGYVESFEPNQFSRDPEVQISIICPKPNFVAVNPTVVTDTPDPDTSTPITVTYAGTVETGFVLKQESNVNFIGTVIVRNMSGSEQLFTVPGIPVDSTQYFLMSSEQGNKFVRSMYNQSIVANLLSKVSGAVVWPKLIPGANAISVATVPNEFFPSPTTSWVLTYYAKYGAL
jgi:hypothetical protein